MLVLALDTSTWRLDAALVSVGEGGDFEVRAAVTHETGKGMHSRLLPALLFDLLDDGAATLDDLDGMAVGLGPGSFTGLRTGIASLASISYSARIPLKGASSLASMAVSAHRDLLSSSARQSDERSSPLSKGETVGETAGQAPAAGLLLVPVLDARRGEVYAGFYRLMRDRVRTRHAARPDEIVAKEAVIGDGLEMVRERGDMVVSPKGLLGAVDELEGPSVLVGSGIDVYADLRGDERARLGVVAGPSAVSLARLCAPYLAGPFDEQELFALRPTYVRQRVTHGS